MEQFGGEKEVRNPNEDRFFRAISNNRKRPRIKVSTFTINLNLEELINLINDMEEYFEY